MSSPPTPSNPPITISHASPPDFPTLSAILPLANASNPIEQFMFRPNSSHSKDLLPPSQRWAMTQFRNGLKSHLARGGPRTHVLKAEEGGGRAVGFAIVRVFGGCGGGEMVGGGGGGVDGAGVGDDGGGVGNREEEGKGDLDAVGDDGLDQKFCEEWMGRMKDAYERHMGGKDHAYWSTLMVLPEWQGQGIGSSIIRWALDNLRLERMPVWLNAQPDGYSLYKRLGWKDIEDVDIDLGQWAGPNKGYGIHRTVCMLRDPSIGGIS